jgi:hypothetical protein
MKSQKPNNMKNRINVKISLDNLPALLTIAQSFGYKCFDNRSIETYAADFKRNPWIGVNFRRAYKDWLGSDDAPDLIWEDNTLEVINWLSNKVESTCKLNDSYTAFFKEDGIQIGGQTFTYDAMDKLHENSLEFREFHKL